MSAESAGALPAERVHPNVERAMTEWGIDLSSARPKALADDMAESAARIVSMGCELDGGNMPRAVRQGRGRLGLACPTRRAKGVPNSSNMPQQGRALGSSEDAAARLCQNQDLQNWRDIQDFVSDRLALFDITGNPPKPSADERLPSEYARRKNPENPLIPQILIPVKTPAPASPIRRALRYWRRGGVVGVGVDVRLVGGGYG